MARINRIPAEVTALNDMRAEMANADYYTRVWSERNYSPDTKYTCQSVAMMILKHLNQYFYTLKLRTDDLKRITNDYETLFDVAVIIASGSTDTNLTSPEHAYTSRILRILKIPYLQEA